MKPTAQFHNHLEQQVRLDREHEAGQAFRARYESERRDRAIVRRELERGVPEGEIEEHLALASDFVRLNTGQDVRAYVRGLIDEEKSSFHALSGAAPPFEDGLPGRGPQDRASDPTSRGSSQPVASRSTEPPRDVEAPQRTRQQAPSAQDTQGRTAAAEASVRDYVNENFKPDDWLAVVAVNRQSGETVQRVSPAWNIVSSEYQRWLRHLNATGSDVYMSLNTFKEHTRGRTKEDLKEIRHLYLDLDEDGARKLEAIRQDSAVPAPNYILSTSPGKFQVIWRAEGIGQDQAETMLRDLAGRYGGDPAATDSTRVFRLPGFNNKKYGQDVQVSISREALATQVYASQDFRIYGPERGRAERAPDASSTQRSSVGGSSQSERDWAYAVRKLKAGEDPNQIIRDMASYRSKNRYDKNEPAKLIAPAKPRPYYYAEQTVTKAMASLGITKPSARSAKSVSGSRETENAPSR